MKRMYFNQFFSLQTLISLVNLQWVCLFAIISGEDIRNAVHPYVKRKYCLALNSATFGGFFSYCPCTTPIECRCAFEVMHGGHQASRPVIQFGSVDSLILFSHPNRPCLDILLWLQIETSDECSKSRHNKESWTNIPLSHTEVPYINFVSMPSFSDTPN